MTQKTFSVESLAHKAVLEAELRYGQSVVRILRQFLGVARKLVVATLEGFHAFVEGAEQQRTPRSNYWWDSPGTTQRLFK